MNVISQHEYTISDDERRILSSTQEEADTRVFLHTIVAVKAGCKRIIIHASDTDIVVIGLYMYRHLCEIGLSELFVRFKAGFIPIHVLAGHLTENEQDMLPLVHALSGCDTNGFVYGKGKRMFMKAVVETEKASELASLCNSMKDTIAEETVSKTCSVATKLFEHLYAKGDNFDDLNSVRAHMYYGGSKSLECIPPTDDAFRQHVLRAIFQTHTWVSADDPVPPSLNPFEYGWSTTSGIVKPVLMLKQHVPTNLSRDTYCRCKKKCIRNCSCKKLNVKCEVSCSCRGQPNDCVRAQFEMDME